MIDLREESVIPLGEVPGHIPPGRGGRRVNLSTVNRWALRGVSGIRLETVVCGGRRYTDRAAIARFIAATTAARERRPTSPAASQTTPTPAKDRRRSVNAAKAEEGLSRAGV